MFKKSKFLIVVVACMVPCIANAYTNRNTAVIQVMNKAAGKPQTLNIPVGQSVQFEKLNLTVRACKQSDPFKAENFYAFVGITANNNTKIFSNWMDRNNPGKNPVQNPDYDAWLMRCE